MALSISKPGAVRYSSEMSADFNEATPAG